MGKFIKVLAVIAIIAQVVVALPTVVVAPFEVRGGITRADGDVITELFISELVKTGKVRVASRADADFVKIMREHGFQNSDWSDNAKTARLGKAINASHVIRGQLMKMGDVIYITATMLDVATVQITHSADNEVSSIREIRGILPAFCSSMLSKMPVPNHFVGRWMHDGALYIFCEGGSVSITSNTDRITYGSYSFCANYLTISRPNSTWRGCYSMNVNRNGFSFTYPGRWSNETVHFTQIR